MFFSLLFVVAFEDLISRALSKVRLVFALRLLTTKRTKEQQGNVRGKLRSLVVSDAEETHPVGEF